MNKIKKFSMLIVERNDYTEKAAGEMKICWQLITEKREERK